MRPVPPFRRLLPAERRLWDAFPTRSAVDLRSGNPEVDDPANSERWGRRRTIRAPVITALLLGAREARPGFVAGIRLAGARVVGRLDLHDSTITQSLRLEQCDITETIVLSDATTKSIVLGHCQIRRVHADRVHVNGDLSLSDSTLLEGINLSDAHVTGQVRVNRTRMSPSTRAALTADVELPGLPPVSSKWTVWAGGITVDGGFFCHGARFSGGLRLIGARLRGGLHMQGASITTVGTYAIEAAHLESGLVKLSRGFTAEGTVGLRSARVAGSLSFVGARLSSPDRAVRLSHAEITEVLFLPDSVTGVVDLSYTHFGVLHDNPSAYPGMTRLNGTTYEQLRGEWTLAQRLAWVMPTTPEDYRPQPYEQLAAWYRGIGNEPEARQVLLAKQRMRRRTLTLAGRSWGVLLDAVVGYGYRPWLAAIWAVLLLVVGTVVFDQNPPSQIPLDEERTFFPFVYTLDLLVPVSVFEQRGAWEPVGWTQWLAWGIITSGWVLATALIAGTTRVLRPRGAEG